MVLLQSSMVPLESSAPDFNLKGTDGQMYSLESFAGAKVLVAVFMCNHCPYVLEIWDDLVALEKGMSERHGGAVAFVGINSNANPDYPDDSFENMQAYVAEKGQGFPYLFDEEQLVAKAYDAQCTPDIFIYDAERKLAYRGAFSGVEAAAEALLAGEKPTENQKYSMGCSIKWC
jgi:peroxiredoxin